jgi:phosphoserine phosphatase
MDASEDGSVLTGKVLGDIVDGQRKKEFLETIAKNEGISLDQV